MTQIESNTTLPFFELRGGQHQHQMDLSGYWSYPIFKPSSQGMLWAYLILTAVPMPEQKKTALFRPKAYLETLEDSVTVVSYQNYHFGNDPYEKLTWDQPMAMYPHQGIAGLTKKEYLEKEVELVESVKSASEAFANGQAMPGDYKKLWLQLTHPIFLPFVKAAAPEFAKAIGLA